MTYHDFYKEYLIPDFSTLIIELGGLLLSIQNRKSDWLISYEEKLEQSDLSIISCKLNASNSPVYLNELRFNKDPLSKTIRLTPLLQDKSIVASPDINLNIQSNSDCPIYINSPIELEIYDMFKNNQLCVLPTIKLSKTWFGSSKIAGELSYHLKTSAEINLDDLIFQPYRAISKILIDNLDGENIVAEKIRVPVHNLSLYYDDKGHLWTQNILYKVNPNGKIKIEKNEPMSSWTLCSEQRELDDDEGLIHNLKNLVL